MNESIVIQRPGAAAELVLLFHGVGASANDLAALGRIVADAKPGAMVVSVNSPHASSLGRGFEWFSVVGVTEQNRAGRVAEAMNAFRTTVAHWQQEAGVAPARTTLIGFSQGSIMSLEASLHEPVLATRVVAIAGRFAVLPQSVPASIRFHFIHGEQDQVIAAHHGVDAAHALGKLGAAVTLDTVPALGHGVDGRVASIVVDRLKD
jgi:phospholipase/carboxylesterase